MSKDKKEKKDRGNHVSIKSMIIAMIAALLAFLGIGNFNLGNGDGADIGNKDGTETTSTADGITTSESEDSDNATELDEEVALESYRVILREEQIFVIGDSGEIEISIENLEKELMNLENGSSVTIEDDGALNRIYEDVLEIVDGLDLRR